MNRNHGFIHKLKRRLQRLDLGSNDMLAVAVSGGADSVGLLHVLAQLRGLLRFDVCLLHVHHGLSDDKQQFEFRNRCQDFCQKLAQQYNLDMYTNSQWPENILSSEAEFRDFRWQWFFQWQQKLTQLHPEKIVRIALAHHKQDALETRLIHLIRGAGESGVMGMFELEELKLRPFLSVEKSEVVEFLRDNQADWIEDPSNTNLNALRNWIRHQWLPQLESHRPGATSSLARSLQILSEMASDTQGQLLQSSLFVEGDLCREVLRSLSHREKCRAMALFLSKKAIKGYTSSHVEELLKRLDTNQKRLSFTMLSVEWIISETYIRASRV